MAVFHPYTTKCACGTTLTVHLAESINVKRSPATRDAILRGELHRTRCPGCERWITVEKPFYYTDLTRNAFFRVAPRGERHQWRNASRELDAAVSLVPDSIAKPNGRTLRVVFGMDELREKLLAQDHGLDDRVLELLKVLLVSEHPVLLRRPRLRLVLDRVTDDALEFVAAYEHDPRKFRLAMPQWLVKDLVDKTDQLEAWVRRAAPNSNVFVPPDHWVNMWRWSPQPPALDHLQRYARQIREGRFVDTAAAPFRRMLNRLPRGSHLPGWAKRDLRTLFEHARAKRLEALESELFELRFGIELEDDWSVNGDPDDVDTLWRLLKDLPDTNVEGNTTLHEILLDERSGGGSYDPVSHDIAIGSNELANRERFEDVIRHEVGHGAHELHGELVNGWLETRFGWKVFGTSDADINAWVALMGGWGDVTGVQRGQIRQYLRTALGAGNHWVPGPAPSAPAGHAWLREDFGPRLAYERTGPHWFQNFSTWYRSNGRAFFLNYWYRTLMAVDVATLDLVARMPDAYASMSHFEFFAETYALYYDLDDPGRNVLPADVTMWLDEHIGAPEPDAPHPAAPVMGAQWGNIRRPVATATARG